jgi:hypothetical protein
LAGFLFQVDGILHHPLLMPKIPTSAKDRGLLLQTYHASFAVHTQKSCCVGPCDILVDHGEDLAFPHLDAYEVSNLRNSHQH